VILSEHFTLEELIASSTAVRLGIDNTPSEAQIVKLRWLAAQLEPVRLLLGPLHVDSGYRCIELNRALRSDDNSQHVRCEAADLKSLRHLTSMPQLIVPDFRPIEMCRHVIAAGIPFDQLIYEYDSWMHISFAYGRPPRLDVLTINSKGRFKGLIETQPPHGEVDERRSYQAA